MLSFYSNNALTGLFVLLPSKIHSPYSSQTDIFKKQILSGHSPAEKLLVGSYTQKKRQSTRHHSVAACPASSFLLWDLSFCPCSLNSWSPTLLSLFVCVILLTRLWWLTSPTRTSVTTFSKRFTKTYTRACAQAHKHTRTHSHMTLYPFHCFVVFLEFIIICTFY